MGISLFVSFQEHSGYTWSMDNLLIAKLMHDIGKPFPSDQCFTRDGNDFDESFFFTAIPLLLDSPIVFDTEFEDWGNNEQLVLHCDFPLATQWQEIRDWAKAKGRSMEVERDEQWIMEQTQNMACDYLDLSVETILTSTGLHVIVNGTYGLFYKFLEKMIQFKQRLETQVEKWKNKLSEGDNYNGTNAHYFGREQNSKMVCTGLTRSSSSRNEKRKNNGNRSRFESPCCCCNL